MTFEGEIEKIYNNLKSIEKGVKSISYDYREFLDNIKKERDAKCSLLCLLEIVRIDQNLLSQREKDKVINFLVVLLKKEELDLKVFFEEGVVDIIGIERFTDKFLSLIKTIPIYNRTNLQKIIARILDSSKSTKDIIKRILLAISKDKSYNDIFRFTKKSYDDLINQELTNMEDKDYIDVFVNLESFIKHTPRKIESFGIKRIGSCGDKYKYVEAAVNKGFINEIILSYYNDKDVKIRQLLAKSKFANNKNIILRFLNDNDPLVRCNVIDNLDIEDVINMDLDVFDRIFDVNEEVRQTAFRFYDKFFAYIQSHHCSHFLENKENFIMETDYERTKRSKTFEGEKSKERYSDRIVLNSILKLFLGLRTSCKEEYSGYIDKLNLSLKFYEKHSDEPGVDEYLEIKGDTIFQNIEITCLNKEQKRLFFAFYKGLMTEDETRKLIQEDLLSAMFYLKNKEIVYFIEDIYEKLKENNLPLICKIITLERIEMYKDSLNPKHVPREDLVVDAFISHGNIEETVANSFDKLFYFAKKDSTKLKDLLKEIELTDQELFEVLNASRNLQVLSIVADRILETSEKFFNIFNERMRLEKRILGSTISEFISRDKHNLYLYILMTGNVKVRCVDFFISFVHFMASASLNKEKVGKLFKQYLTNVPKETFYEFASVCYNLKTKSMYTAEEQEYNRIQEKDDILYHILQVVLNFNVYKILEKDYNLSLFHDVVEENIRLVLSKH